MTNNQCYSAYLSAILKLGENTVTCMFALLLSWCSYQ